MQIPLLRLKTVPSSLQACCPLCGRSNYSVEATDGCLITGVGGIYTAMRLEEEEVEEVEEAGGAGDQAAPGVA